mmetsp:Transcript_58441/g.128393  ORF Transcript_58441/g.128393 Transcript_58441/m.128393 type:complete len:545 (+) Transcript_58441:154-1788(+)
MIQYEHGFQLTGSVFPSALKVALPSATLAAILSSLMFYEVVSPDLVVELGLQDLTGESSAWTGFTSLVGFLVVFRTSQAYSRFWDGCTATYMMQTEWFDACSSIISFCKASKAGPDATTNFENILVRMFSMLHALALAEIEDSSSNADEQRAAFNYELIDIEAIDTESLRTLKASDCKVELVFQWIQQILVENINTQVLAVPPPILSRAFQELAAGMVQFNDALKISSIPFPFPYAQTCDALLFFHAFITPFVMVQWVAHPWTAFVMCFMQVFVLWCLNFIALEIQNPFGSDANDIDAAFMQDTMNSQLMMLLTPTTKRTPRLKNRAKQRLRTMMAQSDTHHSRGSSMSPGITEDLNKKSFSSVFGDIAARDSVLGRASSIESLPEPAVPALLHDDDDDELHSGHGATTPPGDALFTDLVSEDMGSEGSRNDPARSLRASHGMMAPDWNNLEDIGGWQRSLTKLLEAHGVNDNLSSCHSHRGRGQSSDTINSTSEVVLASASETTSRVSRTSVETENHPAFIQVRRGETFPRRPHQGGVIATVV